MQTNEAIILLIEILLAGSTTFEDGHEHALSDETARELKNLRDVLQSE